MVIDIINIIQIVFPVVVLIFGIINLIVSMKKQDRLLILKDINIVILAIAIIAMTIRIIWQQPLKM